MNDAVSGSPSAAQGDFLDHRPPDALRQPAMDLPLDDKRIDLDWSGGRRRRPPPSSADYHRTVSPY